MDYGCKVPTSNYSCLLDCEKGIEQFGPRKLFHRISNVLYGIYYNNIFNFSGNNTQQHIF